jgi:transposase InsO family protein
MSYGRTDAQVFRSVHPRTGCALPDAGAAASRDHPPTASAECAATASFNEAPRDGSRPGALRLAMSTVSVSEECHHHRSTDAVLRWHRSGFRLYWRWKSRSGCGRPKVPIEVRTLIRRMNVENPLWGAPRIHRELLKLGIAVAQSTVAKYMAKSRPGGSGQTWKAFLRNHTAGIGAMDFVIVPTINFRLLSVLVILRHERRRLISLSVTDHPTAEWIAQQITEAFPWDEAPTDLIRDRDARYGHAVGRRLVAMGIRDHPIAPRTPWQNGHAERLIGSIRRECLDHVVILGESHLRRILCCLLQPCPAPSCFGQRCAAGSSSPTVRPGHWKTYPRRTSSPVL